MKPNKKLSELIIEEFPENYKEYIYCEPFCGCCNVFLKKEYSEISVLNDLNKGISNFLTVLRDDGKKLITKLKKAKYNQKTFIKELKRSNLKVRSTLRSTNTFFTEPAEVDFAKIIVIQN